MKSKRKYKIGTSTIQTKAIKRHIDENKAKSRIDREISLKSIIDFCKVCFWIRRRFNSVVHDLRVGLLHLDS